MGGHWISYRFSLSANIGGVEFPDVVQFSSNFAMQGIPQGSIMLPVGRNCETGDPATIHEHFNKKFIQVPAEVYLTVTMMGREGSASHMLWEGTKTIFEGYATGVSWRRAHGSAQAVVGLLHWMSDLNYSSALSGTSHPGNPGDFTFGSTFRNMPVGGAGVGGDLPNWVPVPGHPNAIAPADIQEDLWEKVLKPWMIQVSEQDPIDFRLASLQDEGNKAAIKALERIHGRNMGMTINAADAASVAEGVRNALIYETWNTWVNTTLWGKLLGDWCPDYWFVVVPRISDALAVPICGGVREPFKTIRASEYAHLEMNMSMKQILGNVGILHSLRSTCGGELSAGEMPVDHSGLAAVWPPNPANNGLKLLKTGPTWLADPIMAHEFGFGAVGDAGAKPIATVFDEDGTGDDPAVKRDPKKAEENVRPVLVDYAHQWYVNETLKGRQGELSGGLRFDIAPGSSVKVEGIKELHTARDGTASPIHATVWAVSTIINSELQRAGTSFSLAHVRNEAENGDERWSIEKPPLYQEAFLGAPLLE